MEAPKRALFSLMARQVLDSLAKRNIEGFYADSKADALRLLLDMIPKDAVVSSGGSATLEEIGARDALHSHGCTYLDPNSVQGGKAMDAIAHEALGADYYLMSANAITYNGEIVNADGYGNRVAALIFGPGRVIIIAGMNKVVPTLEDAIRRVKTQAAPQILLKFRPDGYASYGELSAASEMAMSHLVITSMSTNKERIKVILVGERVGF